MSRENLPIPTQEAIVYENDFLYICCASYPITKGHLVVVWKEDAEDIHSLTRQEYELLMDSVQMARDAQLTLLGVKKVYLIYMDEAKQVHWHLVPRYKIIGFSIFSHSPKIAKKFPLAKDFRKILKK
jgi:diadenosine tetraphosphate (Ap4A) HIT family hydrolase